MTEESQVSAAPAPTPATVAAITRQRAFSQSDLDDAVDRRQQEVDAEYEATAEQARRADAAAVRVRELETLLELERIDNLRTRIANDYGISPKDRAILITGTNEEDITAQARRLREKTVSNGPARRAWKEPRRPSTSDTKFSFGPSW